LTAEEIILVKNKKGKVIGFEVLNDMSAGKTTTCWGVSSVERPPDHSSAVSATSVATACSNGPEQGG
jgi:hypothetical protein